MAEWADERGALMVVLSEHHGTADEAAVVDLVSDGRLRLVITAGYVPSESTCSTCRAPTADDASAVLGPR